MGASTEKHDSGSNWMTPKILFRICGAVLLVEGGLLILLGFLPSLLLPVRQPILDGVRDPDWTVVSVLAFLQTVLVLPALTGLYLRQVRESGRLGFLGFAIAFFGTCLYLGMQYDMAFVWPQLAVDAPALVDYGGPLFRQPPFSIVHMLMIYLSLVGYLLFGIATIRARVFDRWRAILLTIGLPAAMGMLFPPFFMRMIGGTLGGISFIAVGWTLFKNGD